ncbi:erythromycin esterase-like protein [Deinobacterium chartae]|uniref:Erythromycin esterase-like protein n=1 Tax=Deinobacterium chartae TaxID=521158 RepID=A0A841I1K3_9DEIO|nr:erythromycin esterase family protein [Deinobacterium chartae]MBB6099691.1 erythromycin esterase-like protein [Deinobacterium chartae]
MPDQNLLRLGWNMAEPHSALSSFLNTLPEAPQLLALGEPTHGVDTFPAWRNRIFRTLVEGYGFRSIALESDIIAGQRVNAYITTGQGSLEEVMRTGFSHGFGASAANRELVEWMRAFNAEYRAGPPLHFYGFDAPLEWWAASPASSLLALHAFLDAHLTELPVSRSTLGHLCGTEDRWTNPATVRDATQSIGDRDEARQLRLLADDLGSLLRTETPHLTTQPGFWEAQLHARTAMDLLRYHALLASRAPNRVERMAALRDRMMADNLLAIAEREQQRGPTLVFAHHVHLQRSISRMQMGEMRIRWWGAGAHISRHLGSGYAFITSDAGTVLPKGIGEPAPETLQGTLMRLAAPVSLLTPQALAAVHPEQRATRTDLPIQAGYFSLKGGDLHLTDGLLFIKNATS